MKDCITCSGTGMAMANSEFSSGICPTCKGGGVISDDHAKAFTKAAREIDDLNRRTRAENAKWEKR